MIGEGSRIYYCPEYDPGLGSELLLPDDLEHVEVLFEVCSYEGFLSALDDPHCTDISICGSFTLEQDLTLTKHAIIDDGITVAVPEGVSLTVAENVRLIFFEDSNLVVNGEITGAGGWPGKPETPTFKRGDVNSDGVLNAKDVTMFRYLAGGYGVMLV